MYTTAALTREEWLGRAAVALNPRFEELANTTLPLGITRISIGFPTGGRNVVGECWSPNNSLDQAVEIFISPVRLHNLQHTLNTLTHELVHACNFATLGRSSHGKIFSDIARAVGLVAPMTASTSGPELTEFHNQILASIGPFPGAAMALSAPTAKKQSTRMLKVQCPDCDYTVRTTAKWVERGLPTCPCGAQMGLS